MELLESMRERYDLMRPEFRPSIFIFFNHIDQFFWRLCDVKIHFISLNLCSQEESGLSYFKVFFELECY